MTKKSALSTLNSLAFASLAMVFPIHAGDFASELDASTEGYVSLIDGKFLYEELKEAKLWQFIEDQAGEGVLNLEKTEESAEFQMGMAVLGEELFVSLGEGSGALASRLMKLNNFSNFLQMKGMVEMLSQLIDENLEGFGDGDQTIQQLLKNSDQLIELLDGAEIPPILIGSKVSDAEMRGRLSMMLEGGVGAAIKEINAEVEAAQAFEFEQGGVKFKGLEIMGEKLVEALPETSVSEAKGMLGEENYAKALELVKESRLVAGTAVKGDYLLVYLGSSPEGLKLVDDEAASLAQADGFAFINTFAKKKLLTNYYFSKPFLEKAYEDLASLAPMAKGVAEGLKESENLGDTRELEALLDMTAETEGELYKGYRWTDFSGAGFFEDGLKFESEGGSNYPNVDLKSASRFKSLAENPNHFLTATWSSDPYYAKVTKKYANLIGETAYTAASMFTKLENETAQKFAMQFGMFDQMFKADLLSVWGALNDDLAEGLGGERALVFDLNGSMPTLPGIPNVVVKEGKAPRFTYLRPVTDRTKLAASWERVNKAAENILVKVGEMSGQQIPMQEPMSSDKDGLTTWFMQIPMTSPDFIPAICVSDDIFAFTTSQKLARQLGADLKTAEEGKGGAHFSLNVEALKTTANHWTKLVEENGEEILGNVDTAEEFIENLPMVKELTEAVGEIKEIKSQSWLEGEKARNTLHLRTK